MNQLLGMIARPEDRAGKASEAMEHHEAIEMMASEQYLLGELSPELRDAYEEHMFGCRVCANDVRFGAAFVDHAKTALPQKVPTQTVPTQATKPAAQSIALVPEKREWFAWLRPAFMVPAFACLLAILGYQNLVFYPALQAAATEPHLLPSATVLHGDVRSGLPVINADLVSGSTLSVPLPQNGCDQEACASYRFDFYDSKGKLIWSRSTAAAASDDTVVIWLPGHIKDDSYKLAVTGVSADGRSLPLQQQFFELRTKK